MIEAWNRYYMIALRLFILNMILVFPVPQLISAESTGSVILGSVILINGGMYLGTWGVRRLFQFIRDDMKI